MGAMKRGAIGTAICALLLFVITASARAEGGSLISSTSPFEGPYDCGLVFSTHDLLLGLESYQAGIGAKFGWENVSLRGIVDFTLNGSSHSLALNVGAVGEYHFIPGPISPYVGALLGGGYMTQSDVTSTVTFSLGALAGVEVFIWDFLSVFAEYAFQADFSNTTDYMTAQTTFDYLISTGMGSSAKLGIVIYFMRAEAKGK
jgi:hypothetical protein